LPAWRCDIPAFVEIKSLKIYFETPPRMLHAVDDMTFSIDKGKTMRIVGEFGSESLLLDVSSSICSTAQLDRFILKETM
jgi:ABC-type dipeptide/oligopeptide/nickel transport system ATPase component